MSLQLNEVLCEVAGQAAVRNVPQLDRAVLGRRRNDVVVERVPFDVQNGTAVTGDLKIKRLQ